eukprot:CAMPEP_0197631188 /NCGR_PEP_ID=MMETSP1338-20131121/8439_1 /TAXON_ID=43686 ORGANISM="Pelagodinium beii, Strain RCC1491" /NCGR_SAMPLE_ID=MMETSP1338 /ASSEMBLY_ACC=CAM_ASM_000754 /LENGTH=1066 /DNA_ID=CAMNT_0043202593 /DNA_START=8 /DNA_END=3208 /DNA_ORIENTATION=-
MTKSREMAFDKEAFAVATQLQEFISCDNKLMSEFVKELLCPFLNNVINELCYAMPKDPGAFLIFRLLEKRDMPKMGLREVKDWVFRQHSDHGKARAEKIADGDTSGGVGAIADSPQPPERPRAASTEVKGTSPKAKLIVREEGAQEKRTSKDKGHKKDKEASSSAKIAEEEEEEPVTKKKHVGVKQDEDDEVDEEEELWEAGDESSSDEEEKPGRMTNLRKSVAAPQHGHQGDSGGGGSGKPNTRKSAAVNMNDRKRRFTVSISTMALPPPPQAEILKLMEHVPFFQEFSLEQQKEICKVVRCNQYDEDEIITNAGNLSDAIHIVFEGKVGLSVPKSVAMMNKGEFFGEEALKFTGARTEYQVTAQHGQVKTLSLSKVDYQGLSLKKVQIKKAKNKKARKAVEFDGEGGEEAQDLCKVSGKKVIKDHEKTEEEKEQIINAIKNNKVLHDVLVMSKEQQAMICDAVYLIQVETNDIVVHDKEKGKGLFIVQSGMLETEHEGGDHYSARDAKILPGETFGELTLLYDSDHQSRVKAVQTSWLWVFPRGDFVTVSRLNSAAKIQQYSDILLQIGTINQVADLENIDMVAGALEELSFLHGEEICLEGQDAGNLFILLNGEAVKYEAGEEVGKMMPGEWVGEMQMALGVAATTTVKVCSEEATVANLDEGSWSVICKAIGGLKKKMGERKPASATRASQLGHGHQYIDHVDKENFADGVLKKQMAHAIQHEKQSGGGGDRRSVRKSGLDFALEIDMSRMEKMGALGEGSFGTVILIRDNVSKKEYALKGLLKDQIKKESLGQSVSNERSIMALLDSEFITRLYGTWQDRVYVYFLQEPVMGGELFDVYTEQGFFGELKTCRFYIACVIAGLAAMHEKRVIYRDLKLENCLVGLNGYVKLTDMGIAKMVVGKTYTVCGTADYFAPETLKQTGHNRGADWWACGVLLFIMCAGRSPFDAPEVTQIYKNIIKGFSKVSFPETFPSDLTDVIKSLCRKVPEERITMQKGGVENLQEMPFFTTLDWDELMELKITPPYLPETPDMSKIAAKELSRPMDVDHAHLQTWNGGLPTGI